MHVVEARGVVKHYRRGHQDLRALDGVDLAVAAREFVAVTGPSGSGKTTLLNMLGALDTPDEGEVRFDGRVVSALSDVERTELRRMRIGFVFQQFHLVPTLTALENVALPLVIAGTKPSERLSRANDALSAVGLGRQASQKASELSGGEQQRVGLARALVRNPQLLLADEPTGNLDSNTGLDVMNLLLGARERDGVTVVVVTHDARVASLADRVVRLRDGRLDATHDLVPSRRRRRAAVGE